MSHSAIEFPAASYRTLSNKQRIDMPHIPLFQTKSVTHNIRDFTLFKIYQKKEGLFILFKPTLKKEKNYSVCLPCREIIGNNTLNKHCTNPSKPTPKKLQELICNQNFNVLETYFKNNQGISAEIKIKIIFKNKK